jgi:hypothetical protein
MLMTDECTYALYNYRARQLRYSICMLYSLTLLTENDTAMSEVTLN